LTVFNNFVTNHWYRHQILAASAAFRWPRCGPTTG